MSKFEEQQTEPYGIIKINLPGWGITNGLIYFQGFKRFTIFLPFDIEWGDK